MARILIGVCGGIAAYKTVHLVRLAIGAGHAVRVIQTPASRSFVGSATFEAITGAPVLVSELEPDPLRGAYPGDPPPERVPISHLALVENADAYLIAPASANTIAKLAAGMADNLVCAAALVAGGGDRIPLLLAPAMNDRMYEHPALQANLSALEARGARLVGPESGELASHGEHGLGRMSEPPALLAALEELLAGGGRRGAWRGRRVLITAGGTREPIDGVRYIGNRSSGRMGLALAARAAARGADVTVLAANVTLPAPPGVELVAVRTAAELEAACVERFERCDVLLMAAAVADFRPRAPHAGKLSRGGGPLMIELEPTVDVLASLASRRRNGQLLVGFAAEHGPGGIERARRKLDSKRLDAIVVNDVSQPGIGFDAADNAVTILTAGREPLRLKRAAKERIADGVLDHLEALLEAAGSEAGDRAL
ncbi:MAG TPA: bifunctional phosphopantothenoylcysteine decarboxylase/phosphopantothenate--cysteine ligase CoaBC [Solirubrobacteraceae bacterium]|nr:bifunctional phosphopantothenoylcysteine decarboxylase/phosphopantothenate--cysteine ligase CoaBC [Solirubrobacteraceae bacterium]